MPEALSEITHSGKTGPIHLLRNYRIISVMFWSFPYLLWQAFGHWSGFLVGVIVAVILTILFNDLFRAGRWNTAFATRQRSLQSTESQSGRQEVEFYHTTPHIYQAGDFQPQYEEARALYPEMPPME